MLRMVPPRFVLFLFGYIVSVALVLMLLLPLFFVPKAPWMLPAASVSVALLVWGSIQAMDVALTRFFPDLAQMSAEYTRRRAEDEGSAVSGGLVLVTRTKETETDEAGPWFRMKHVAPHDSLAELTDQLVHRPHRDLEGYESRPAQLLMTFTPFTDQEADRFSRRLEAEREKAKEQAQARPAAVLERMRATARALPAPIAVENTRGYLLAERLDSGVLRPPAFPFFASREDAEHARSVMEPDAQPRFEVVHGTLFVSPNDPPRARPVAPAPLDTDRSADP